MKFATLAGMLSMTVATAAFAQTPPAGAPTPPPAGQAGTTIQSGGPGQPGGGQRSPHELKGDTNHDGFVSKDEWRANGEKMFDEIDLNHDGKISPEEMHAHHEKERLEHEHGGPGGPDGPGGQPPQGGPQGGPAGAPPAGGPAGGPGAPAPANAPTKH